MLRVILSEADCLLVCQGYPNRTAQSRRVQFAQYRGGVRPIRPGDTPAGSGVDGGPVPHGGERRVSGNLEGRHAFGPSPAHRGGGAFASC